MGCLALLGIFLLVYMIAVVLIAVKKPMSIWNKKKIQFFIKVIGEKGTVVFFCVWSLITEGIGIWLRIR